MSSEKAVRILGIRGLPASHGGFETFADYFARYLAKKGWSVTVYCQEEGAGSPYESEWEGVRLVHIPVKRSGSVGSVLFDGLSAWHASKEKGLALTLGYNTAFYSLLFRLRGIRNIMNMDGIEWKRGKWSMPVRGWFWLNEKLGSLMAHHLVADHPEMKRHLTRNCSESKITVSAYGAESITKADEALLEPYGIKAGEYLTIIARPEPENSFLEMVTAFSAQKRDVKLVVLGNFSDTVPYQRAVKAAASEDVLFVGAIYEKDIVSALRYYCIAYMHGHTVGGTNPSLLEALGAGNPVIAQDNRFNSWVADKGARYFSGTNSCKELLDRLLSEEGKEELEAMAIASRERHKEAFQWDTILAEQEAILQSQLDT